jgi:zinc/manganese transport system substrate-binding protein
MGDGLRPARGTLGRVVAAALALALALVALAGCSDGGSSDGRPRIVVTTPMLGAIVRDVAGDAAEVHVLMPNGADPHDFQPSARDVETLTDADLVVENGLGLEEGLEGALDEARRAGVPVFTATDHVHLREAHGEAEEHEAEHGEEGHDHGSEDPHIWMDPLAMRDMVAALAPAAGAAVGADLSARGAREERRLVALAREIERDLAVIPADRRRLVTGHDSMGYFADRFGFELVGSVIPSFSSQAEVSAGELADLKRRVAELGVPAVFTELGTPPNVAEALADEAGISVLEVPSHALPADGGYAGFMRAVAGTVREGLAPPSEGAAR